MRAEGCGMRAERLRLRRESVPALSDPIPTFPTVRRDEGGGMRDENRRIQAGLRMKFDVRFDRQLAHP
jgi:hypothetical protein